MKFGTSYFGNRIVRHVNTDMKKLSRERFDLVIHTFSENDHRNYTGTMRDIVRVTRENGLEVWLDPWGLGGIFGGEAFSSVALQQPNWAQRARDGTRIPACCPNNPNFRQYIATWIDTACDMNPQAIFWDEPHFFSDRIGRVLGCSCRNCGNLAEEHRLTDPDAIREVSILSFLEWACRRVKTKGGSNAVCLLPSELSDGGRVNWETVARLEGLDHLGTDPYWAILGKTPETYIKRYAQQLSSAASPASVPIHIWIQGFSIPGGREEEITRAVIQAAEAKPEIIAVWGFDACSVMSSLSCERPEIAWKAFLKGAETVRDQAV